MRSLISLVTLLFLIYRPCYLQDVLIREYDKDDDILSYERKHQCECLPWQYCEGKLNPIDPNVTGAGVISPRVIKFGPNSLRIKTLIGGEKIVDASKVKDAPCKHLLLLCCNQSLTDETKLTNTPIEEIPVAEKCGQRNRNGAGNALYQGLGEETTQFGEFPWMAMIMKDEIERQESYVCGGSLIGDNMVVTAAHCVYNRNALRLKVRLGEWDAQHRTELFMHEDYRILRINIHPEYSSTQYHNNVAVLVLQDRVQMKPHINTLCIPNPIQAALKKYDCTATGWGKANFKAKSYQNFMKKIEDLPVVENDVCEEQLRGTRLGQKFTLHPSMMCAGGGGKDTCTGDGGGPLACTDGITNQYYLAGIISWGIGCKQPWPGVYADVSKALPWLDRQIELYNTIVN